MFLSFDINYIFQINADRLTVLFHKDVVLLLYLFLRSGIVENLPQLLLIHRLHQIAVRTHFISIEHITCVRCHKNKDHILLFLTDFSCKLHAVLPSHGNVKENHVIVVLLCFEQIFFRTLKQVCVNFYIFIFRPLVNFYCKSFCLCGFILTIADCHCMFHNFSHWLYYPTATSTLFPQNATPYL